MFLEEWKLLADDEENVVEVDGVFIAKATKIKSSLPVRPVMSGCCACGAVQWEVATNPIAICHYFCVPCRKVSGGYFLTMMEFPAWAVTFVLVPTFTKLKSIAHTSCQKSLL